MQKVVNDAVSPEKFEATVIEKAFVNGSIVFTLDRELPYEWFHIISNGDLGSYSALMGYEPERLEKEGKYGISMRLRGHENENSVRTIVKDVTDWIMKANARYTAHIKQAAQLEQRQKEEARKAEIAKIERENSISAILAQL